MMPVTATHLRWMVAASWLLGLAGSFVDVLWPALLPPEWRIAAELAAPEAGMPPLALAAFAALAAGGWLASTIAMCLFKPWGRRLCLWSTALSVLLPVWVGAGANSGAAGALLDISSMLWGAVLALAYFSPLAQRFVRA